MKAAKVKNNRRAAALLGLLLLLAAPAYGQTGGTLVVRLTGMKPPDAGKAILSLYDARGADCFPDCPEKALRNETAPVAGGEAEFRLSGLGPGAYAVAAIHDANGNGKFDTNWMGVPTEGYGASNNPRNRFGPPEFREARFNFSGAGTVIVKMQ